MTVYLLPCGISILDGLTTGRGIPDQAADIRSLCDAATDLGDRIHHDAVDDAQILTEIGGGFADKVADAELSAWTAEVSAETYSLDRRYLGEGRWLDLGRLLVPGRDNQIVLLASDTARGLAAALIVAARLSGDNQASIGYTTSPDDRMRQVMRPGRVSVVRIRDLDPQASPDRLVSAAAGLGRSLRWIANAAGGQPIEVHLTGGYKSTLLQLLAMTEILHSQPGHDVSAWYLHDDVRATARTVAIGLRRFSPNYLKWMHHELTLVTRGERPDDSEISLEGVGWEINADRPRLTGFGVGYLELFGGPGRPKPGSEG